MRYVTVFKKEFKIEGDDHQDGRLRPIDYKFTRKSDYIAKFHKFGSKNGNSVAIIERYDGTVKLVPAEDIEFIK